MLLLVGTEPDQDLTRDSVVRTKHRPQCERGVPELHRHLDVLHEVQAETAPLLGDGVTEQSHLGGLCSEVVRDGVGCHDLELAGNDPLSDEVVDLLEHIHEDVVGHLRITGVHTDHYRFHDYDQSNT